MPNGPLTFINVMVAAVARKESTLEDAAAAIAAAFSDAEDGFLEAFRGILSELERAGPKALLKGRVCLAAAKDLARSELVYQFSHSLASLARLAGNYEEACDLLAGNIAFLEAKGVTSDAMRSLLVREHLALAHLFNSLGHSSQALEHTRRGLSYDRMIPPLSRQQSSEYLLVVADAKNTAACVYKDAGDIESALVLFDEAQAEVKELLSKEPHLSGLALLSGIQNNRGLALERLAYQMEEGGVSLGSPRISSTLASLGIRGRPKKHQIVTLKKKAVDHFREALGLIEGTGHFEFECRQRWNIALRLVESDPDEAIRQFSRVRELAAGHNMLPLAIEGALGLVRCYRQKGRPRKALREARRLVLELEELYSRQRTLPFMNRVLTTHVDVYKQTALCCCDLSYFSSALGYMERIKSRLLLRQMMVSEFILASTRKGSQFSDFNRRVDFAEVMFQSLGAGDLGKSRYMEFDGRAVEKAARLLGKGARLLIYLFSTSEGLFCFLIGGGLVGNGRERRLIRIPAADYLWMRRLVENEWQRNYLSMGERFQDWVECVDSVTSELAARVWSEIESHVTELEPDHLVFIPHTGLHFLPIHLMPVGEGEVLLDRYSVSYAPSLSTLSICRTFRSWAKKDDYRICVLADPTSDLAYAGVEAELVAKRFNDCAMFVRDRATVEAFEKETATADIIHLACHGYFSQDHPTESGLFLADGVVSVEKLGSRESLMPHPAWLVVLSACESGIVALDQVDEFIGLPYGFLVGGCATVVSTLWPVDDMATTLLVDRFYSLLLDGRMSKAKALRCAQMWVRSASWGSILSYVESSPASWKLLLDEIRTRAEKDADSRPYAHPFYWGGFVCHGYWD